MEAAQKLPDAPFSFARLSEASADFTIPKYIIVVLIMKGVRLFKLPFISVSNLTPGYIIN